jgi:hypothetical protein
VREERALAARFGKRGEAEPALFLTDNGRVCDGEQNISVNKITERAGEASGQTNSDEPSKGSVTGCCYDEQLLEGRFFVASRGSAYLDWFGCVRREHTTV